MQLNALTETFTFLCPYCWEANESFADLTADQQSYIEDCQVCCHPVQISFSVDSNKITDLQIERAI